LSLQLPAEPALALYQPVASRDPRAASLVFHLVFAGARPAVTGQSGRIGCGDSAAAQAAGHQLYVWRVALGQLYVRVAVQQRGESENGVLRLVTEPGAKRGPTLSS